MNNYLPTFFLTCIFHLSWTSIAIAEPVNMPMRFTADIDPKQVLMTYPIGKLNKMMALSHHGKEDKNILLPNSLEAWVYDFGFYRFPKDYILPSGKKKIVYEKVKSAHKKMFLLVFSNENKVIDVIYKSETETLSALQVQLASTENIGGEEE